MCYDLTISRNGRFIALDGAANATLFKHEKTPMVSYFNAKVGYTGQRSATVRRYLSDLAEEVCQNEFYLQAEDLLRKKFCVNENTLDQELSGSVIRPLSEDGTINDQTKYAAVLPGIEGKIELDSGTWGISARAAFTACAMEEYERTSKLWWNFAVRPLSKDISVGTEEVSHAIRQIENIAADAHVPLQKAFTNAVSRLHEGLDDSINESSWHEVEGKLIVNFTDNDQSALNEYFTSKLFKQDYDDEMAYLEGEKEFLNFVRNSLEGQDSLNSDNVESTYGVPSAMGLMYRFENESDIRLTGFARRPFGGDLAFSQIENMSALDRKLTILAHSAARPVSALVANREANLIP